jgi:Protein of unknown function (DUF3305)
MSQRPSVHVAVTMRKERMHGAAARWIDWRWVLHDVVVQQTGFGAQPRLLLKSENEERWLYPDYKVELFRDDAEGYYLNATTDAPCWFVLWRMEDEPQSKGLDSEQALAIPTAVSLSYHDAGRWLDAQEKVDQVPAPVDIAQWLSAFAQEHFVSEPKKRKRPQSFIGLEDRFGSPASVSTEKKFGGGQHGG